MMDVMGQSQAFFNLLCDIAGVDSVARILRGRLGTAEPAKEPRTQQQKRPSWDF